VEVEAMTKRTLEYSSEPVTGSGGGIIVYALNGQLCGTAPSYAFQDEVRKAIGEGTGKIVLDLGGVERIDSCGIGILASLMWSASQAGGGMVLASVPKQVEKLLGIVMLLDHIEHADSRDAAVAMLARR
jgi:anti-anti-sigma factor